MSISMEVKMATYLVVAHQSVTNPKLLEKLKDMELEDPSAEFTLLVPATPVRQLLFWQPTEHVAAEVARELADKARTEFEKKHVNLVAARAGTGSPLEAIDSEVKANPGYAGVVISTLSKEDSRWLGIDLPELVQRKYGLPVHVVSAPPEFFGTTSDSWKLNAYFFGSGMP
jgi:hypothetical protein